MQLAVITAAFPSLKHINSLDTAALNLDQPVSYTHLTLPTNREV